MTIKQALAEAVQLWGENACVERRKKQTIINGVVMTDRFVVGRVEMGMFFAVKGDGPSFEAAFEKAAQAEERERARITKAGIFTK